MLRASKALVGGLAVASMMSLSVVQVFGAEVLWTAPGARVCVTQGDGLEFENPLTGTETALGYPVREWLDADYAPGSRGWYDDWSVNSAEIDGSPEQIWMRRAGHQIYTVSTLASSVVSVHLVGDANDGLADIYVDGSLVVQLDMGTAVGTNRACSLITGLSNSPHTIEVHAMGAGQTPGMDDVATMGAAVLSGPKWTQGPDLESTGMDVLNTYRPMPDPGFVLADDFPCTSPGALTAIRFWGSWYGDYLPFGTNPAAVSFTLSIHEDIPDPDGPGPLYSMPGALLWTDTYGSGECEVALYREYLDEGWLEPPDTYEPSADTKCWLYECPGPDPADFEQEGTPTQPLVYWLDLQAVPEDPVAVFGWKTSPDQWNDGAVWASGVDEPGPMSWQELRHPQGHPFAPASLDLAFEIWGDEAPPVNETVCEPQPPSHHPGEYWYRATQTSEWCAFHVRVLDENPSNYSNWNVPPGWVFEVHEETDGWWASWRDPAEGCPNAISGTFTFRFTNPNPGKWDIWVMNTGNSLDPSVLLLDGSCNHETEPDGFGHMVHVPAVCVLSNPPAQPLSEGGYEKNRYLTFAPANPGRQTAIRVTFADLPPEFDYAEGRTMWVGEPGEYTENSGKLLPSEAPGSPTFWAAELQCDPYYTDWSAFEEVHVYYGDIIPGGTFDIQMIDKTCYTTIEGDYSEVLAMDTSIWGDVLGTCAVSPCSPPNGTVGIPTDVTGVLDKFKNLEGAPTKARCDIEPAYPDLLINISDVTYVLEAFRGFGYPFPGPAEVDPCP